MNATKAILPGLILLGLIAALPAATAVVGNDSKCGPVSPVTVCVSVTIIIQTEPNSWCTSRGETVPAGETCYSIEYDISGHTTLPVGGVSASGTGAHYGVSCSSTTSACYGHVGPFALAATSSHCDSVHGHATDLLFQSPEANTGSKCA